MPFESSSDALTSGRDRSAPALRASSNGNYHTGRSTESKRAHAVAVWPVGTESRTAVGATCDVQFHCSVSVLMKTQGEIEAGICDGVRRFEQEYMGRGPKDIHTHLIDDLLVVRLQGVLTAAEQQLVGSLPAEKGRELLKQVRTQLIETARPVLEAMVREVTGVQVVSLHHDISTMTGEEVILFTLAASPVFRDRKAK